MAYAFDWNMLRIFVATIGENKANEFNKNVSG